MIIRNGAVVDKLERDVGHEEWTQRLLKACGVGAEEEASNVAEEPIQSERPTTGGSSEGRVEGGETPTNDPQNTTQTDATPIHHQPEQLQALLAERGQRLEAERLRREAQEKAERIARARARREEEERAQAQADKGKQRADGSESAKQKARLDWVQQQAKRKQEAKEEKQRIMARIEADKRERKNRDEKRKQAASAMAGEALPAEASKASAGSSKTPPTSGTCAIQVRLFDGSSIKGKFAHDSTLGAAVREWIKEVSPAGGADIPFNFRQILTPNPSRTIEISEEGQTLSDVGLMPTATLVLVPVAGYTEAYTNTGGGIMGSAYNLVSGAFGLAGSALGYVTGYGGSSNDSQSGGGGLYMGGTADEQEPSNVQGTRMANADSGTKQSGPSKFRVKTMAEQRAENEKGAEFYNGNSLGTEGRKDDDSTDEKQ